MILLDCPSIHILAPPSNFDGRDKLIASISSLGRYFISSTLKGLIVKLTAVEFELRTQITRGNTAAKHFNCQLAALHSLIKDSKMHYFFQSCRTTKVSFLKFYHILAKYIFAMNTTSCSSLEVANGFLNKHFKLRPFL